MTTIAPTPDNNESNDVAKITYFVRNLKYSVVGGILGSVISAIMGWFFGKTIDTLFNNYPWLSVLGLLIPITVSVAVLLIGGVTKITVSVASAFIAAALVILLVLMSISSVTVSIAIESPTVSATCEELAKRTCQFDVRGNSTGVYENSDDLALYVLVSPKVSIR